MYLCVICQSVKKVSVPPSMYFLMPSVRSFPVVALPYVVERGQERPLKLGEKFVLLYNSPLCLHCNCNREKLKEEKAKMRAMDFKPRVTNHSRSLVLLSARLLQKW